MLKQNQIPLVNPLVVLYVLVLSTPLLQRHTIANCIFAEFDCVCTQTCISMKPLHPRIRMEHQLLIFFVVWSFEFWAKERTWKSKIGCNGTDESSAKAVVGAESERSRVFGTQLLTLEQDLSPAITPILSKHPFPIKLHRRLCRNTTSPRPPAPARPLPHLQTAIAQSTTPEWMCGDWRTIFTG